MKTSIEWTDDSWNPVRGVKGRHHCTKISPGCANCYAETINLRFSRLAYTKGADGLRIDDKVLMEPLGWKKPRRCFVCSMTDLFHESLPMESILRVFSVMQQRPQHTFQVLTKRPERAWEFVCKYGIGGDGGVYPANVWMGVSVENQKYADERLPVLLKIPAPVRFVSYEPALGPVDFEKYLFSAEGNASLAHPMIQWLIVGGESGHGARPFNVAWARSAIAECKAAGVACFVKQLGAQPVNDDIARPWPSHVLKDSKGGDMAEWPEDLRVREFPAPTKEKTT